MPNKSGVMLTPENRRIIRERIKSREKLAAAAGITQAMLSMILAGKRRPSEDTLRAICRHLRLSCDISSVVRIEPLPWRHTISMYRLVDPRDNRVRYIGQAGDLQGRVRCHSSPSNTICNRTLAEWLNELFAAGLKPICEHICDVANQHGMPHVVESVLIQYHETLMPGDLVNVRQLSRYVLRVVPLDGSWQGNPRWSTKVLPGKQGKLQRLISDAMKKQGKNRRWLCRTTKISSTTVGNFLSGEQTTSHANVELMLGALQLTPQPEEKR